MATQREKPKHDTVMDVTEERIARVYAVAFMEVAAKSPNAAELDRGSRLRWSPKSWTAFPHWNRRFVRHWYRRSRKSR